LDGMSLQNIILEWKVSNSSILPYNAVEMSYQMDNTFLRRIVVELLFVLQQQKNLRMSLATADDPSVSTVHTRIHSMSPNWELSFHKSNLPPTIAMMLSELPTRMVRGYW